VVTLVLILPVLLLPDRSTIIYQVYHSPYFYYGNTTWSLFLFTLFFDNTYRFTKLTTHVTRNMTGSGSVASVAHMARVLAAAMFLFPVLSL
jgi:hypothetical protein